MDLLDDMPAAMVERRNIRNGRERYDYANNLQLEAYLRNNINEQGMLVALTLTSLDASYALLSAVAFLSLVNSIYFYLLFDNVLKGVFIYFAIFSAYCFLNVLIDSIRPVSERSANVLENFKYIFFAINFAILLFQTVILMFNMMYAIVVLVYRLICTIEEMKQA